MKITPYKNQVLPSGQGGSAFSLGGEKRRPILTGPASIERWEKAGQTGDVVADIGQKMIDDRRVNEFSNAQTSYRKAFADLDDKMRSPEFVESTDYKDYEEHFDDESRKIWDSVNETLTDDKVRKAAELDFEGAKIGAVKQVRRLARNVQIDKSKADTLSNLKDYRDLVLRGDAAGNTTAAADAMAQAEAMIAGKVAAGTWSEVQGKQLMAEFQRNVGVGLWEKRILNDPKEALAQLQDPVDYLDEADRTRLYKQARAELERQESAVQRLASADRYTVKELAVDDLSSLRATGQGVLGATREVSRVLGKTAAEQHTRDQNFALRQYRVGEQLKAATPEEAKALVESLVPEPGTQGFERRQQLFEYAVTVYEGVQKQLAADPAGYVMQFRELRGHDAMLAEQERLGVPSHRQSVIPMANADALVKTLMSQGADDLSMSMQTLSKQYGKHWPVAYRDLVRAKLPDEIQLLSILDRPGQAETRIKMSNAIKMGEPELKKALGPDSAKIAKDIDEAIDDEMTEFTETILRGGGSAERLQQLNRMKSAARLAAMAYAVKGMDPEDAAERVVDDVFNSRYVYEETYRIPVEHSAERVNTYADSQLKSLGKHDPLVIPGSQFQGISEATRRTNYIKSVKRHGYWVTNEDETGLVLMDSLGLPVLKENGSRIEFAFEYVETGVQRFKINKKTGAAEK